MIGTMKLPEDVKAYFRKQGRIGAQKRSANLSPERRREIARLAAEARWTKKPKQDDSKKGTK
jgi:hypothetical protein